MVGGILGLAGLSAVAGLLVTAAVTPAIALSGYTASGAITMFENLPSNLEVDQPMLPTTLYAKDEDGKNRELATFYDQNRIPLKYDDVPQVIYDAVLSSEDPRFYDHGGVDLIGTSRALLSNAAGGSTQGASTISQQYVKNVQIQECEWEAEDEEALRECYLEATDSSGTEGYQRKLLEMRLAISMEKRYTKEEILLGYLNIANFGGQTYGVEAAAQRYFGKTVSKLDLGEAAVLAGIVQNPNLLRIDMPNGTRVNSDDEAINSKEDGYAYTKSRQKYVLNRMLDDGKITQDQHDEFYEAPVEPNIKASRQGCQTAGSAAYYCEYVTSVILNDKAFGETAEDRRETLRRGGLKVYTTMNPAIQRAAEETVKNNAPMAIDGMNFGAAVVSVDPRNGDVLAIAQNTKYTQSAEQAKTPGYTGLVYGSDRARGGAIGFSAGSTYKLFTLIDWLENGRSVNESISGVRRDFSGFMCDGSSMGVSYNPGNFGGTNGYTGTPMTFTKASLNSGFIAMAEQLDICEINRVADRMGVTYGDDTPVTENNNPADVLGGKNVAPIDLASAFGTVANGGVLCDQRAIRKIVDTDGEEVSLPDTSCDKVIEPEVAATATYALEGVMAGGGTGSMGNPGDGTPLIGKTGTHEDLQTMLVESSTRAATAVWVGNASGTGSIFGHGLQNIRYSLARDTQAAANATLGSDPFPDPDSELTRVIMADLPNVAGKSIEEAKSILTNAGFSVGVGDTVNGTQPEGTIQRQDPGGGSAPAGSRVTIYPSNGAGVEVPDVSGKSLAQARGDLQSAGLSAATGSCSKSKSAGDGEASSTSPDAGSVVSSGTKVTINYKAASCGGDDDDDDKDKDKDKDKDDDKDD